MGGFECSCHHHRSGKRLDLIAATQHDTYAHLDYRRLREQGLYTARDGLRWPLIEKFPGHYDFSSALPQLRAARRAGVEVIWDLCHYGWPDDIDIFKPEFVQRFARYAQACARILLNESEILPLIVPINEISFWAWAGGDVAYMNPFVQGRGDELKFQLIRAAIEAIEAIWSVNPHIQITHVEPVVNVIAAPNRPQDRPVAKAYYLAQYEVWDILTGRQQPQLGGHKKYLGLMGINYYPHNQWLVHDRAMIPRGNPFYRPFRDMLAEIYQRYGRPLFISETGAENEDRPGWLRYVSSEVQATIQTGVPVEGICLYPILNHPGWDDDRHCCNGLWDYPSETGAREIYQPLAQELHRQQALRSFSSYSSKQLVQPSGDIYE